MKPSLRHFEFFKDLSTDLLTAADDLSQWASLPAGRALYEIGDPSEEIYAVTTGSLAVTRPGPDGRETTIGHVRAGELVGEMSFFAGHPRRSNVTAIRDTELLRIDQSLLRALISARPDLMEDVIQLILSRTDTEGVPDLATCPKVIGFVSIDSEVDARDFANQLAKALQKFDLKTVIIGSEHQGYDRAWFDQIESAHDFVLFVASMPERIWSRSVLRQSDRAWILCRTFSEEPESILGTEPGGHRFDLVAVGRNPLDPSRISRWRQWNAPARLLRWNYAQQPSVERIARLLTGRSIGLVLSGGGARAYAHIGVVRALREARKPIDFIGGTSMGAIIGACVAIGWDDEEIEARIKDAFVDSNPLGDFILPVVSLSSGHRVDARLQRHFGEIQIEDLEIPFFAVSSSITRSCSKLHRTGRLRDALRASIALPGILPPVVDGEDLLVDGAVLNNFPVEEMRHLHAGPVVGVDVARTHGVNLQDFVEPPNFWGWVAAHGVRTPPPIVSILMRAGTAAVDPTKNRDLVDLLILPEMPEIDLRDWRSYDEAVSAGYEAATAALAHYDWKQLRQTNE